MVVFIVFLENGSTSRNLYLGRVGGSFNYNILHPWNYKSHIFLSKTLKSNHKNEIGATGGTLVFCFLCVWRGRLNENFFETMVLTTNLIETKILKSIFGSNSHFF